MVTIDLAPAKRRREIAQAQIRSHRVEAVMAATDGLMDVMVAAANEDRDLQGLADVYATSLRRLRLAAEAVRRKALKGEAEEAEDAER